MTPKYREYISNSVRGIHLDTVGVVGSIPIEPTIKSTKNAGKCPGFSQKSESLGIAVFGHNWTQKDPISHRDCGEIAVLRKPDLTPTFIIRLMRYRSKIRTEGYARPLILTARSPYVKPP